MLQPNDPDTYYKDRELVPTDMLEDMTRAKIVADRGELMRCLRRTPFTSSGIRRTHMTLEVYGRLPYNGVELVVEAIAKQFPMEWIMHADTVEKSARTARLEARITDAQKDQFQRAAELQGRSLSDFVVASIQEAATRVIQEHEIIRLTQRDRIMFVAAILDDRAPSKRLVKAAQTYCKKMGL